MLPELHSTSPAAKKEGRLRHLGSAESGTDLAEISASVGNVAQRPGSETIEEIVLEQNGHRLPA
jgi:hypothetical protein